MNSSIRLLRNFFKKEQSLLEENYPGINLQRIENDFSLYMREDPSPDPLVFFSNLKKAVPLEYINGKSFFYKSEFIVNPNVLIPRSETEILVERALDLINKRNTKNKPLKILDVGTGSGAIILSLMQESELPINAFASDISEEALEICRINYFNLGFTISKESNLEIVKSDRLNKIKENFDLIVSNPPYIKKSQDKEKVHGQVDFYEPHLALYLDDELYTKWFKDFFKEVYQSLNVGGYFFMEGHEDHLEDLKILLIELGFKDCGLIKDYTQRLRFLKACK